MGSIFTTKPDRDYLTGKKESCKLYEIFRETPEKIRLSRKYGFYVYVSERTFEQLCSGADSYNAECLKAASQRLFEMEFSAEEFADIIGEDYSQGIEIPFAEVYKTSKLGSFD